MERDGKKTQMNDDASLYKEMMDPINNQIDWPRVANCAHILSDILPNWNVVYKLWFYKLKRFFVVWQFPVIWSKFWMWTTTRKQREIVI